LHKKISFIQVFILYKRVSWITAEYLVLMQTETKRNTTYVKFYTIIYLSLSERVKSVEEKDLFALWLTEQAIWTSGRVTIMLPAL